ncbi:MAG: 3-dehydroquinate synthase [Candidatus Omnitrophota bacterium]|nr:3-dehydroquinate synthase [Candidatus Omnitrophota bacterium]
MKKITVRSSQGAYSVYIGRGILSHTGRYLKQMRQGRKVMVVTQKKIARYYLGDLKKSLRRAGFRVTVTQVPDGERAKSRNTLFSLYHSLLKNDFERDDVLVALGGGVVGDVVGFAASSYLRGIRWVNVATTLLAQVDSSIGGKTGINLDEGKNLVGAFYPPKFVISDVRTLTTLPDRQLRASLAEVVKYGVIRDAALFRFLERRAEAVLRREQSSLETIVRASVRIKANVVERDEFEKSGERMILNYGHTIGHALEKVLGYQRLVHGEAVAVGMVAAAHLAEKMGMISRQQEQRQNELIKKLRLSGHLNGRRLKCRHIVAAMMRDKKKKAGKLRFVLPLNIGKVAIRSDVPLGLVRKALLTVGAV